MTRRSILAILMALFLFPPLAHAAPREGTPAAHGGPAAAVPAPAPASAKSAPAPVVLEGKTLFHIRETVLSVTPEGRAAEVNERLGKLVRNRAFDAGSIQVVDDDLASILVGEGTVLMRVFDRDAAAEGTTRQALAARYAETIRAAIEAHNEAFRLRALLFAIVYAVVATGLLAAVLLLYHRFFPRVYARIGAWGGTRIPSFRIGSYDLLPAARLAAMLAALARWFRILTTVLLVYVWLLYVLSLFPWTRRISTAIVGYILDPLRSFGASLLESLPDLFMIAVIGFITRYAIKVARFFFDAVGRGKVVLPGFYADWAVPTYKIVRFFILAFAFTVAFPYIPGSRSEAFKGVSIFLGILFSLGSTSAISNVMGGLSITYMRAYRIGDRVRIGDTVGDVIGKSLLVTHVRTIKNEDITVPNAMIMNTHVVNYSARAREEGLILHTSVTIGYDAPWRTVHELLIEAARKTERILAEPEPFVLQTALNDFYVTYELNAYTDEPRQMVNTYSSLHRNIQDSFNGAGVEIMSPHYAQLRDGNRTAIPDAYLPPGYVPRSHRVARVPEEPGKSGDGR